MAGAPVGLAFWDLDLRFRHVNRAFGAIAGVEPAALLGLRVVPAT